MTSSIQGQPVSPTPLANGEGYVFNGSMLVPTAIGGGPNIPFTRVYIASTINGLNVVSGGTITMDTEQVDQNNAWSALTPDRFVIPATGVYKALIYGLTAVDAGTGVVAAIGLISSQVGPTPIEGWSGWLLSTPSNAHLTAVLENQFTIGDEIVFAYSIPGGAGGPEFSLTAGAYATLQRLS